MGEMEEQEFVGQYEGYPARKAARDLHRALHPVGMHTNGPCRVQVEASHLMQLLKPFKVPVDRDAQEKTLRAILDAEPNAPGRCPRCGCAKVCECSVPQKGDDHG
jgi:hypothetical protein